MIDRLTRSRSATSAARDSDVISVRRKPRRQRLDRNRRRKVDRAEDAGLKIVAAIIRRHQRDVELFVEHHDARDRRDECADPPGHQHRTRGNSNEDHHPESAADAAGQIHQPRERTDVEQHEHHRCDLAAEQSRRQRLRTHCAQQIDAGVEQRDPQERFRSQATEPRLGVVLQEHREQCDAHEHAIVVVDLQQVDVELEPPLLDLGNDVVCEGVHAACQPNTRHQGLSGFTGGAGSAGRTGISTPGGASMVIGGGTLGRSIRPNVIMLSHERSRSNVCWRNTN